MLLLRNSSRQNGEDENQVDSLFRTMVEKLPLLSMPEYGILLLAAVARLKESVRSFFYHVVLSLHRCPKCNGQLLMVGNSVSRCTACGNVCDPTIEFQRCVDCGGRLVKKTYHYHCKTCHSIAKSEFLFDEKVFDKAYFCQMMRESRERKRRKKAQVQAFLRVARSDVLAHEDCPDLGQIEGLNEALDSMVNSPIPKELLLSMAKSPEFDLTKYKEHIVGCLQEAYEILFDDIQPLIDNTRKDRAFRFVTLIFMNHWGDVELIQYGDKVVVEKVEAHS